VSDAPGPSTVEPADAGTRLATYLARRLALSLSQVTRLLDRGAVRVDGRAVRRRDKGLKLVAGQQIAVETFTRPEDQRALPEPDAPLDVLAADPGAGWVVVNKPAGAPVHPLEPTETGTVLNALAARFPAVHGVGEGGLRSGVVHRLDVETSGALVLAIRPDAWRRLRDAFREHRATKIYHAIVLGDPGPGGQARLHLAVTQHRPARVRVLDETDAWTSPGARACDLTWRRIERLGTRAALVEVTLRTGFLHQVRVTMAHLGHPIAGDAHYGGATGADPSEAARPMLHARRLAVEGIDVVAPEPADFVATADRLRRA
jgi:23S rRNA pseudouridine1911/1915/1917 synthase